MGYLLLTGATGLLGRRVLRDALLAGMQVAALVRRDHSMRAAGRIDSILHEEEVSGRSACPRPIVLQGDLLSPDCGLGSDAVEWIARHCDTVIHCAASLSFEESPDGEPFKSNVEGTRHLLALCERTGIRTFHHVSTAYVAGDRSGRAYERELDVGQRFSNAYEQSKRDSEHLVRRADHLDKATVFRPAIIVGDSRTGRTCSFHGIYVPLQLGVELARSAKHSVAGAEHSYFQLLGLHGDERKNLVTVDWIAAVLLHVVKHPEHHGATYHLTSDQPVTVREINEAITEAIITTAAKSGNSLRPASESKVTRDSQFVAGMQLYRDYFRDDPEFDKANTNYVAGHLVCPCVDRQSLVRLAKYAISVNFGWPRAKPLSAEFDFEQVLKKAQLTPSWSLIGSLGIDVSGPGGGQWQLKMATGQPIACGHGLPASPVVSVHLHVQTLQGLVRQALDRAHVGRR